MLALAVADGLGEPEDGIERLAEAELELVLVSATGCTVVEELDELFRTG